MTAELETKAIPAPAAGRSRAKLVAFLIAAAAALALGYALDAPALLQQGLEWCKNLGWPGYAVFALLYIAACVFFIPGTILTLGGGAIYGVAVGFVLVSVSSVLGASCAFLVGRYLARDAIARRVEGNARFQTIDKAVADEGWKIVFLTRMSPVFPFNLLNYGFGLTRVPFRHYFLASWIGMIPGTAMYVYIGSLAGELATLGAGERARTPAEWALFAAGLIATVLVTVYITKIARKALQAKVNEGEP